MGQARNAVHRSGARHRQQHARDTRQEAGRSCRVAGRLLVAEPHKANPRRLQATPLPLD